VQEALRGTAFSVALAATSAEAERAVEAGSVTVALAALSFPGGNGYDSGFRSGGSSLGSLFA
jgi:DNA-binding response OmpR family regulator